MTKRFPGFLAVFAFFVVCVCGLVMDVPVEQVCLRALVAMAVFFFLGLAVGTIVNRILLDSMFGEEETSRTFETLVDKSAVSEEQNKGKTAADKTG
ncbi:MAG: hypothetical protein ABIH04_04380 [Planctomycetota bacterium]